MTGSSRVHGSCTKTPAMKLTLNLALALLIGGQPAIAQPAPVEAKPETPLEDCSAHKFETIFERVVDGETRKSRVRLCGQKGQSEFGLDRHARGRDRQASRQCRNAGRNPQPGDRRDRAGDRPVARPGVGDRCCFHSADPRTAGGAQAARSSRRLCELALASAAGGRQASTAPARQLGGDPSDPLGLNRDAGRRPAGDRYAIASRTEPRVRLLRARGHGRPGTLHRFSA